MPQKGAKDAKDSVKSRLFFPVFAFLFLFLTGCDSGLSRDPVSPYTSTPVQYSASKWNLSVQDIQSSLKTHPLVKWTPGQTYITNLYNATQAKVLCGLDFATPAALIIPGVNEFGKSDRNFKEVPNPGIKAQTSLPPRFSWQNYQGKDWLTPIKYQDAYKTSVSFACVAAMETTINISQGYNSRGNDLSECYLWYKGTGSRDPKNQGWNYDLCSAFLKDHGTVLETYSPYSLISSFSEPASSAVRYRITDFTYVTGKDSMKEALLRGPLVTGMSVFEDFFFYQEGVFRHLVGNYIGEQAIVIIGYENDNNCWICRNSWSEYWGEKGNFRIFWDEVRPHGYLYSYPATSTFPSPDEFPPETPSILSPIANQEGVFLNPTVQASAFSDRDAGDTHFFSDWEIYLGDQVLPAKRVWYKLADSTNKTSITVDSANGTFENSLASKLTLDASQTYTVFTKYYDGVGNPSSWSFPVRFSTTSVQSTGPWKPYLISPTANQASFPVNPFLISSAFKSTDPEETHLKTDWEIYDNPAPSASSRVWYKLEDSSNLVSILVTGTIGLFENGLRGKAGLAPQTNYWARVRYYTNKNISSEWSDLVKFTTGF